MTGLPSEAVPRPRALIVDDEPAVREIISAILQRDGWESETVPDGDVAIRRLGETQFSVILLDLLMPRAGGTAVIEFMKKHGISTPVVVISAIAESASLDPQIVRVSLQKPFEVHDLRAVLRALLIAAHRD